VRLYLRRSSGFTAVAILTCPCQNCGGLFYPGGPGNAGGSTRRAVPRMNASPATLSFAAQILRVSNFPEQPSGDVSG